MQFTEHKELKFIFSYPCPIMWWKPWVRLREQNYYFFSTISYVILFSSKLHDFCRNNIYGVSKNRFIIMSIQFIFVLLYINNYIIFHVNNCKPTIAHPYISSQSRLPKSKKNFSQTHSSRLSLTYHWPALGNTFFYKTIISGEIIWFDWFIIIKLL